MTEIFNDKTVKNLCLKSKQTNLINVNNKSLFVYDDEIKNLQLDPDIMEYAISKLRYENGKFYMEGYKDDETKIATGPNSTRYSNPTNETYFDKPYFNRPKLNK